jgi:hypothetical protein
VEGGKRKGEVQEMIIVLGIGFTYIYIKVAWNLLKSILNNKHKHHDHAFEHKDLEGSLHVLVLFFFLHGPFFVV